MQTKYHSRKIQFGGETFDSKKEFIRYQELVLLLRAGKIDNLRRQVKYLLIPSQHDEKGKCIERECVYIADFVYYDKEAERTVVEDAKGMRTEKYIIKRKLMLYLNGIRIKEV